LRTTRPKPPGKTDPSSVPKSLGKAPPVWSEFDLRSDLAFDSIYDQDIRDLSLQHWTPVQIAARAAWLLTHHGAKRILDVGSGVGKFCLVGAQTTDATFVGVERRGHLVDIARDAAARLETSRVTFMHANIDSFSFEGFDGIYLYNPFYELIGDYLDRIDPALELSAVAYRNYVRITAEKLRAVDGPVVVVTYHGFGGTMPPEFRCLGEEPAGNDRLEVWGK
jgi:predicted RNA methylase